jgi:hypothetical protein
MYASIRGLHDWRCKDCKAIYKIWIQKIVNQDESCGDPKFTTIIKLGSKSTSYWKSGKR